MYDPKLPVRYLVQAGRFAPMTTPSKEICCEGIVCYPSERSELTLAIAEDGSTAITNHIPDSVTADFTICPITKSFYAIHRNGSISIEDTDSYSARKTVSRGARTDLIYGFPDKTNDLVVFHMNTTDTNIVRADRILREDGLGSCKAVPTGKMIILGIYPIRAKSLYLNIPESCRKNVAVEHLFIKDVEQLFPKGQNHRCVNLSKANGGCKLKRNSDVKTLFSLELM
jgi:hypothetical protein